MDIDSASGMAAGLVMLAAAAAFMREVLIKKLREYIATQKK